MDTTTDSATTHAFATTMRHHDMKKPMWMWFHTKINDLVLFDFWIVTTPGEMIWTCLVIMVLGVLLEFIRYARWRMELANRKELMLSTKYATFEFVRSESYVTRLFSYSHLLQTFCFGVQLVLSYMLMLVFMTFSIWLGLAVCIGAGIGFLLFGSRTVTQAELEEMHGDKCC
ncbi:unnamed protein product [Cylicostephanus goldi]|uniref:Copper transport protein n=1 Tax=Cylicostephanus goldi TaxID=71465 RepID=A0A3P7MPZ8_CYLGO|nr:unnamed protein product [Cylicostephanus goldi]